MNLQEVYCIYGRYYATVKEILLRKGEPVMKNNIFGNFLCLFEIVVGILLLVNPVGFTIGIAITIGAILVIVGLANTIKYFRTEQMEASIRQYLTKGLLALLAGGFCILKADWFVATFKTLTVIYGVLVLATGFGKVQFAIDLLRRKHKKWFLALISAGLSIACACIILYNPFSSTVILWRFTGITLIVEAVVDIVTLIISIQEKKK